MKPGAPEPKGPKPVRIASHVGDRLASPRTCSPPDAVPPTGLEVGDALRRAARADRAAALLVGLLAVFVPVNLPFIGWIVNLALTLIGVGKLYAWALSEYRGATVAPARV